MDYPEPSSAAVSARMQRMPRRDTTPEMRLRRALHSLGLRYRVNTFPLRDLRRRADIIFTKQRVAVFVDGCFWHNCPQHGHIPSSNSEWWRDKLGRTSRRDYDTDLALSFA